MWLDGIFMASPYLAQYGATFGEPTLQDEAVKQILLIARKTYDPRQDSIITDGMKAASRNGQAGNRLFTEFLESQHRDGMEPP